MNKLIAIILALSCMAAVHAGNRYPAPDEAYLDSVDYYLSRATTYTAKALSEVNARLDNLSSMSVEKRLRELADIGLRLSSIDVDSAMTVYSHGARLAAETGNTRYSTLFKYRIGSVMPMMGLVREGIDVYMAISPEDVDESDRFDYFRTGHHIFDAAVDYYRVDSIKQRYKHMSTVYNDSALTYVEPGTINALYYNALPKLVTRDRDSGIAELRRVLDSVAIEDPLFAKAAAEIASAYMEANEWPHAKYYFALSAIGDLRAGTREATSLHRLGKLLNNEEDFGRAYDYLSYALEASVNSGSSLRTIEIGEIMPVVAKAGRELEQRRSDTLGLVVILLSAAVVIFAAILIYALRNRYRLRKVRKDLVDINESKDRYIRKLLALCGAYLTALENFSLLAARKIKVGQINELLAMVESGKVMRDQLHEFYEVFDDAFLTVYPDFVDNVNRLIDPERPFGLTEEGHLSPELRIIAFMRLGVDDSAQIARFLGLSLNTVYTYRNKVKSRAINRETFEADIRDSLGE